MTAEAIPTAAEAGRLTEVLRGCGALGPARVGGVAVVNSIVKQRSHTRRLRLSYDGPAGTAPEFLILKMGHLDSAGRPAYANRREVAFYRDVSPSLPAGVIPRCFEASESTDTTPWHLLLEDLTDSHFFATEHPLPPSQAQCESIMVAWAKFHAAWWDDPRLGTSIGTWPAAKWEHYLPSFADELAVFIGQHGQVMPPERRELYQRLLDPGPRLLARLHARRNVTLVHGDAHWWNCFVPRDGRGDVRLIDWEGWSVDTATSDIAYMMAMLWYPDMRRRLERPLLDRYHAALLAQGVRGYDRQALDDDYRLSVLWLTMRPVGQAAFNIPPRVWWPNLERIFLAVDDLGCRDLLN
ncbi:phosphotransferase [Bradyrhizobium sp. JYMT SZCCT0180]|uniref:phosphotransferase n=1 Tax=Bradyrhizobium sp. JYMT SZCCT0180 TaxID=2807666 RepID=UPI001BA88C95|nr:phosphotransferase [Bradyrhizobium sp. JYMT SZCCT0180]MBR1215881.1 phosphotransferase [Bradyrhizobium sp. JYMT SZCCT0180]